MACWVDSGGTHRRAARRQPRHRATSGRTLSPCPSRCTATSGAQLRREPHELVARRVEFVRAHRVHPDRPVRAVVHRHRTARRQPGQRLGRPPRVQMPLAEIRTPAAHRQQRHVDRPDLLGHVVEQPGVPGEVRPRLALDDVAQRGGRGAVRAAAAARRAARERPVRPPRRPSPRSPGATSSTRRCGAGAARAPPGVRPGARAGACPARAAPAREHAGGRRADGRRAPRPRAAAPGGGTAPAAAAQMREAAREQGIGEHAYVRVLDRAGGVTPPGDLHRHLLCLLRATPPKPTGRSRVGGETQR